MSALWLAEPSSLSGKRIWVAGHDGMVGRSVCRRLEEEGGGDLLTVSRSDLDLRDQIGVRDWMHIHKPDMVIIAAAKVGGILANVEQPAQFFYDNIMIATNIMHVAHEVDVERLLFLGSSCIYPRNASQPLCEDALLTAPFELTNEAYALAKVAGLKMAQYYRTQYGCNFISVMPCNLYGVGDTYHPDHAHVIPSIIMKADQAKKDGSHKLELWGSGTPLREFLYVDDLSHAIVFILKQYCGTHHLNIGSGKEVSIRDLSMMICDAVGYHGDLIFDPSKPDGVPRKLLNSDVLFRAGWMPQISLSDGIERAYKDYLVRYPS